MRLQSTALAFCAIALGAAGHLAAQQSWAITPYASYVSPSGDLVSGPFLVTALGGGANVGVQGEVALAKQIALGAYAASTIGLTSRSTFNFYDGAGTRQGGLEFANAWTQFGATLILRPLGTLPNGAPKTFFLEAGAEMTRYGLAEATDRSGNPAPSWSGNWVSVVGGAGLVFRLTPRLTANIFGRYSYALSEYSSAGLDDWNSSCTPGDPTCVDVGQKVNLLQVGVGIRAGR